MSLFALIIIFSLLGGVLSVIAAAAILVIPEKARERLIPALISFAIGALLGAAFLALLPHALTGPGVDDLHDITLTVLIGLLAFFILEKMVLWRHCHSVSCEAHGHEAVTQAHHDRSAGMMVLIGDGLHNFVDGVLIAAAFLTDPHLGIVTAIAVATHEIPQEMGDFIVLLKGGFSRGRALLFNALSSLTTVVGAVIAYFALQDVEWLLPYVLAVAASCFIYIAVADLIPGLHKKTQISATLQQIALIAVGIAVIFVSHSTLH